MWRNVRNAITCKRLWAHFKKTRKKKKSSKIQLPLRAFSNGGVT